MIAEICSGGPVFSDHNLAKWPCFRLSQTNVKPIRFTIYVATDEQVITKVLVDDRDFMVSVWADVDRALIERGENPEHLTRYEVMTANGAEYLFSNYNQVQDLEIP